MDDDPKRRNRRKGSPTAISDVLGSQRCEPVIRAAALVLKLRRAWAEIAGEVLAGRSEPAGLYRERLVVHVENNAWLNELQFVKADLLERLQALAPGAGVTELALRIGPLSTERDDPDHESAARSEADR